MSFDFDRIIERRGSDSLKWGRYADRDVLPLWVADMDFAAPPAVLEALHRRVDHGVFGYTQPWPSLVESVLEHCQREYRWAIEPEWVVWLPGLVTGLHVACQAVGDEADAVFTATPVYPPFLAAPPQSKRRLAAAPLAMDEGRWVWDFAAADGVLKAAQARLWLLCHPHNPVGRVWDEDELFQILALAEKHDLVVCSDEIHCDLILEPGRRHRPFATLSEAAARRSITLMAPSKTFNVPGLGCAFAIIPEPGLRRGFRHAMAGIVPHVNTLGLIACEAALRHGGPWRSELLAYLRGNARLVEGFVERHADLSMAAVEATYLAWIDARGLGLEQPQQAFEAAGVGLSDGADFGAPGFVRLNFGCPHATLEQALVRMATVSR